MYHDSYLGCIGYLSYYFALTIAVLIIPLSILPKLKIGLKKKLSLCVLFAAGVFCMIAAIMRMIMPMIHINSIAPVLLWSTVEEAVVILVANAPMLRVLFWSGKNFASVTGTSRHANTTLGGRDHTTLQDSYELATSKGTGVVGIVTSPKDRFIADDPKAVLCSVEVNVETKTIDEDASTTKSSNWAA